MRRENAHFLLLLLEYQTQHGTSDILKEQKEIEGQSESYMQSLSFADVSQGYSLSISLLKAGNHYFNEICAALEGLK